MKRALIVGAILIGLATLALRDFQRATVPTIRAHAEHPIYTIGERDTYSTALENGSKILKFGPMFFGLYRGGLAFATAEDAQAYMLENDWPADRWRAQRVSPGYSNFRYTNKNIILSISYIDVRYAVTSSFTPSFGFGCFLYASEF